MMPGPADREETLRRCREIQARLETLTPEARAGLDRLLKESGDLDFISEIIARLKHGSMPEDEAVRWLNAASEGLGRKKARN
jgi:hypothetical protein